KTTEALKDLNQSITLAPGKMQYINDLAYIKIKMGSFENALSELKKETSSNWDSPILTGNIRRAAVELIKKSLQDLKASKDKYDCYSSLAFGYLNLSDQARALEFATTAVKLNPSSY